MSRSNTGGWRFLSLRGEDKARLLTYLFAVVWPFIFLIWPPTSYSVISEVILHAWMFIGALGGVGAILGVLSGIDLKLELPSLYFILIAPFLYFFAQIGFIFQGHFDDRIALAVFVLWHLALMFPRIVSLEAFRRRERIRHGARR